MNFIYYGEKGLPKKETALLKAAELLNTEKLEVHPDFLLVEPKDGSLKVEQLDAICEFVSLKSASADFKVVLIESFDLASVAFQNAMLKMLEDDSTRCHFLLTAEQKLIDTVNSRCVQTLLKRKSPAEMESFIKVRELPYDNVAFAVANGRPVLYETLLLEGNDFLSEIKAFVAAFENMGHAPKQMFETLGLIKESGSFYDSHTREENKWFLEFVQDLFVGIVYEEIGAGECAMQGVVDFKKVSDCFSIGCLIAICERCIEDRNQMMRKGAYSKNDFFEFFRFVYELIRRKE